jgi:hypothetical protein
MNRYSNSPKIVMMAVLGMSKAAIGTLVVPLDKVHLGQILHVS